MKKLISLIAIFSITSLVHADSNFCSLREDFYKKSKHDLESSFKKLDFNKTDIVFLGEPHFNYPEELYPRIIRNLTSNQFKPDCYLLEIDQNPELTKELNYFNSLASEQEYEKLKDFLFPGLYNALLKIHQMGLNIYAVDNHNLPNGNEIEWLNSRDIHMAKEIQKLFKLKQCSKMIYPIGKFHITSTKNIGRVNLRTLLLNQNWNIRSINIDLLGLHQEVEEIIDPQTGKPFLPSFSQSWIPSPKDYTHETVETSLKSDFVCSANPSLPLTEYVILPESSDAFGIYDSFIQLPRGSMNDFDMSVTFSCTDERCKDINESTQKKLESKGLSFY